MNPKEILLGRLQSNSFFALCRGWLGLIDWKLVLLLSLPLLMVRLNDSWIFSYVLRGYIDPWVYFGYFLDLKQQLNTFAGTYYGTRLPWILPGFLAYKLFSPLTAAYVLHLAFYYAAITSLYLILKQLISPRIALLTTVLMGCHYFFLESIGIDYIDGAGLTYMLLTLLMLTNEERSKYFSLKIRLAGIFFGCLIYTQLFLITYIPLIVLYYLFINRGHPLLLIKPTLRLFVRGFIGLTVFLCLGNYFLNGTLFFYMPIFKWTKDFVLQANPWWSSITIWWTKAIWLVIPALTFIGSLFVLIFHRVTDSMKNRRVILFFQVYFILNVLMYIVLELVIRQPVLNLSYYSSYMLPGMFLALGSQFAVVVNQMKRKSFYLLLGFVVAVSLCPYVFVLDFRWVEQFHNRLMLMPILLGLLGFTAIFSFHRYFKAVGVVLVVLAIALVNINASKSWKLPDNNSALQKDSFLAVIKGSEATKSMDRKGNSRFWYNCHSQVGKVYQSLSSTYLWGYRLFNEDFPALTSTYLAYQLVLNDRIFLLSDDEEAFEKANKSLAEIGFRGEFLDERSVHQGPVNYKITHFKVCNLDQISEEAKN